MIRSVKAGQIPLQTEPLWASDSGRAEHLIESGPSQQRAEEFCWTEEIPSLESTILLAVDAPQDYQSANAREQRKGAETVRDKRESPRPFIVEALAGLHLANPQAFDQVVVSPPGLTLGHGLSFVDLRSGRLVYMGRRMLRRYMQAQDGGTWLPRFSAG